MKKDLSLSLALLFVMAITACRKETKPGTPATKKETMQSNTGGNFWTQLTVPVINVPGPPPTDESNISFSANEKLYVALIGYNQLWRYDPAASQWALIQSPFFNFPLTVANTKYVFSSGNAIYFLNIMTKSLKQFDLSTAQWSNKANFPGTASSGVSATFTTTKGYIMAGANGTDNNGIAYMIQENWEYDFVANGWTLKANTPGLARYNAAAYAAGDKVYFGTGVSAQLFFNPINFSVHRGAIIDADWWEYNTTTNGWTQKTSFGGGVRQDTRGFVIGGTVYLGMGSAGYFTDLRSDMWAYNPISNAWSQRASYPSGSPYLPWFSMAGAAGQGFAINDDIQAFWSYTAPYIQFPPTSPGIGSTLITARP